MTNPPENALLPCPCGKPMGVMSRYVGETLHYQSCCSDPSCPLLDTYATAEEAGKVWNDLMSQYTRAQPPALPDAPARVEPVSIPYKLPKDVGYLARDMDILAVILEKAPDAVDADFLRIKRVKNYIIQSSQREVTGEARYQCCAGGCENKVKNIGGICGDCFQSGCGETE